MPPPPPRPVEARGFTLIELLVVISLIAMLAVVLVPQLGAGLGFALDGAARRVADELRYASQRAVATGVVHRWTVNLDAQRFRLEERVSTRDEAADAPPAHRGLLELSPPLPEWEFAEVPNKSGRWSALDIRGIAIEAVWIGDDRHDDGLVSIAFAPEGGADPAAIRLIDDYGYEIDVEVLAFSGEARVRDDAP